MPANKPIGPQVPLQALVEAHRLTRKQLAERMAAHGASITEQGLSNILRGNKKPSDATLAAIADALGIHHLDIWLGPMRGQSASGNRAA